MEPAFDLSVVVVTWNSRDVTAACLESLRAMTADVAYEVFVVDNGSKDDTATEIPRRFPWIRFIANPTNLGFTKANNQAIREARGRYVLLLNSDTIQTENALGKAVQYMDAHADVGALGIMHRNNDAARTLQVSCFAFPRPWPETFALLGFPGKPPAPPTIAEQDVDWACGSFLMIRRSTLERIGLLDERYFAYAEDIDWCLSARRAGLKIRFWPGASMIHLGSISAPHLRDKTGLMFRSQVTYLRKNYGWGPAAGYYIAMGARLTLAMAKQALKWAVGRATRKDLIERWRRWTGFLSLRFYSG